QACATRGTRRAACRRGRVRPRGPGPRHRPPGSPRCRPHGGRVGRRSRVGTPGAVRPGGMATVSVMALGLPSRMPGGAATVAELLASGERSYSFEFFPPKTDEGERTLWRALRELESLRPTFVS